MFFVLCTWRVNDTIRSLSNTFEMLPLEKLLLANDNAIVAS